MELGEAGMNSTELFPVLVESKGGRRQQLRFVASCHGCGTLILDPSEANVAVVDDSDAPPAPIKTDGDATVSLLPGRAYVYCWDCDREQEQNNVPWQNAAQTFRDPAQQTLEPTFQSASTRRKR
jgi:hypothetical protein